MARKTKKSRRLRSSPIVIIGEGLTEQYYFSHLRSLYNFNYTIKPYFFGTTSLKDIDRKAREVITGGGVAVCVFDADVSERNENEKKKVFLEKEKWVADLCAENKMKLAQQRAEIFSKEKGSYSNIYKIFKIIITKQ